MTLVLSLSHPSFAAFYIRDSKSIGRSHIVFECSSMGLLLSYLQELGSDELDLDFTDSFPLIIDNCLPSPFEFSMIEIAKKAGKIEGYIETKMQGFLER